MKPVHPLQQDADRIDAEAQACAAVLPLPCKALRAGRALPLAGVRPQPPTPPTAA